jgi:cell division protease FtsH
VNEAAILAARRNKRSIGMPEFQEAVERVIAGPERRSRLISEQEKEIVAYHEAGHALVMRMLPNADPVHKISVVSRGMALGYTMPLPEEDQLLYGRNKFRDELAGLLGGRVAEEEVFGDVTTGASNDLERVTSIARKMVTQYGMSDVLGPQTFGEKEELVFLGREIGEQRNYSEEIAEAIDHEVRRLVDEAYGRARTIIRGYRAKLDELAHYLITNETIDAEQFQAMFA